MHMSLNWLPLKQNSWQQFWVRVMLSGKDWSDVSYDLWWFQKKLILTMSAQVFGKSGHNFCHMGVANVAAYQNKSTW